MTARLLLICDLCQAEKSYEGQSGVEPHDEAEQDGWVVVSEEGSQNEFCDRSCLKAWL